MTATSSADLDGSIVTKLAPGSVDETVARLRNLVAERGMTVFAVFDHGGEAKRHGLDLRDTQVVVFGSPLGGTPVMQGAPLSALDLPLKVLIWDDGGQTKVSYLDPEALGRRYRLSADAARRLAGIAPLTDVLVSS
ncbi:MAG: DUF302 domain-containing protein [Candidatus Dormiibacterota bacterium]